MTDRVERRLAAILAADFAGYSRLMGLHEEATLFRLTEHRRMLIDPAIARYRGRLVKSTGDGLLAEFASVVDAARCAIDIQLGMAGRNDGVAADQRMDLRIGINVGDIVEQDGDIFGDGVNIAARLEAMAEPGGICVSARVQEDAAGKIGGIFEDLGGQALKNIARPIRAYRLHPQTGAVSLKSPQPVLPVRPAVAVMPFKNMSGDVEQEYFADGVVEDIITALSRFKSFAVIARNSTFAYKGRTIDVRQAGTELGVQYVLEGSVRRIGERLRITAQLIETSTGANIWAERYDGVVVDIFDMQDRIMESVVGIVEPQIRRAEIEKSRRKPPESLDAHDFYLRAISRMYVSRLDDIAEAFALAMRAVELEPDYGPFLMVACWALEVHIIEVGPPLTADDRATCIELAQRGLANANGDATVMVKCGLVLVGIARDYDRGMRIVADAVELNPNNQLVLVWAAIAKLHCGDLEEAIAHARRAILISPGDPMRVLAITAVAHAEIALGRYEDALRTAERSLDVNPEYPPTYWMLIAATVHLGRMDEARGWLRRLRAAMPGVTVSGIRAGQPAKDPARMAAILEALRRAGMDEGNSE